MYFLSFSTQYIVASRFAKYGGGDMAEKSSSRSKTSVSSCAKGRSCGCGGNCSKKSKCSMESGAELSSSEHNVRTCSKAKSPTKKK